MSVCPIETSQLRTTRILSINRKSSTVVAFTFRDEICGRAEPGQFLMLWIPRVDEIPLSILDANENGIVSLAVKKVGEATQTLQSKRVGDIIGIRGPFGNSFTPETGRVLMVSGGTGTIPLIFLAKKLKSKVDELVFLVGAKTREELFFMDELEKMLGGERTQVIATTEDGSYGMRGVVTTPLQTLLEKEEFSIIYTCGPEQMMQKTFRLAERYGVALEASLERLMRCAIGLCGSCTIGRYRVCKDGPVFSAKQLREVISEFGVSRRDFDGKKIPLE